MTADARTPTLNSTPGPAGDATNGAESAAPTAVPTAPVPSAPAPSGARVSGRYSSVWADREFRGLWVAWAVTLVGDQLARVAITVLIFQATGSAGWAAAGYAVTLLPALLGGPLLAPLADRLPRREVMVACDVACAVLTATMAIRGLPVAAAAALLFAVTLLNSPFTAARAALTRDVFPDDRYTTAVAVSTFTVRAALVGGFTLGGVLVAAVGPRPALLLNAATFAVSAILVRLTVTYRPAARVADSTSAGGRSGAAGAPGRGWWADLVAGVRLVFADRRLRTLTLFAWLAAFHVAPYGVVVPYAVTNAAGPAAVGLLLAAQAAGVGLGMTVLTVCVPAERRIRWIVPLSLASSAPLMLTGLSPGLVVAGVLWAVAGAGTAYQLAANVAFVSAVPNARRGQAFGLVGTGLAAGQGLGILGAGVLAGPLGPGPAVAVFGAAGTLAALALARAARDLTGPSGHDDAP